MIPNRVKILRVEPNLLIGVLNGMRGGMFCRLPVMEQIPEGTEVVSMHDDYRCRTLNLVVTHPSFEEVALGAEIPEIAEVGEIVLESIAIGKTHREVKA